MNSFEILGCARRWTPFIEGWKHREHRLKARDWRA
jgi:hypothetical protein